MTHSLSVLGIDIGSSSVRAALFDQQGRRTGDCAQRSYQFRSSPEGESTFDIEALLALVCGVIDETLEAVPESDKIVAVGLSTFWHSLVGVDEAVRPTLPLLSWADRRCARYANRLRATWMARGLHRETGCPAHSSYWPARAAWLAAEQPEVFSATQYWLSAADYLLHTFFGELRTSISMASGTGLFDLNRLIWSQAAINMAGIASSCLPEVSDRPYRGLAPDYARRWRRLADITWYPAVGDGACSNLGAGCIEQDAMALMLGTSGSMRVSWKASDVQLTDSALWCYRVDETRYAGGMSLSAGGAAAAWARNLLGASSQHDIEAQVAAMAPDQHGLTVLPYLLGARSPDWVDGRTGVIAGLTAATQPIDIYRAMLESIGFQFARLNRRLDEAWPTPRRIVATGAALLHSPAWLQIVADCLGKALAVSGVDEGSLRGAALLALERSGHACTFDYPIVGEVKPNEAAHARYLMAMDRQADLDAQMKPAAAI